MMGGGPDGHDQHAHDQHAHDQHAHAGPGPGGHARAGAVLPRLSPDTGKEARW